MGTTVEKLNKVLETKEAIRTSINNKGGTLTENDTFSSYSNAIDNIQTGSQNESITITENGTYTAPEGIGYSPVNVSVATQGGSLKTLLDTTQRADYLFVEYKGTSVSDLISYSDTSNVKYAAKMFQNCMNITSIPNLDFSKVVETSYMFHNCAGITNIPYAIFEKASSCNYMFANCTNLEYIKIKLADNLSTIQYMFSYCPKLNTIDMSSFSPANKQNFASNCYSLKKLIIRSMSTVFTTSLDSNSFNNCYHFYGKTDATYNPEGLKDGRIYVPKNKVEELKMATNWSVFADIILPLELADGEDISNIYIDNNELKLNTPSKAEIYLNEFTNIPTVDITISNESIVQINNINITTTKITFDINALGIEGNATITVNISGDYNKTLTTEVSYTAPVQYTIEKVNGATYGFELNSNGYYESTNKRISNSYSLCKLVFVAAEKRKTLKLECINSGESSFDFGILSNIDTTLSLSSDSDSTNVYKSFKGQSSTKPVVITYPEATVGEHFIYIKYKKDSSGDEGTDSLQFKVI